MADYLIYLSNNSTAYNSYFKWRKYVNIINRQIYFGPICEMCIQLQLESHFGIRESIINNLNWNYDGECRLPEEDDILIS